MPFLLLVPFDKRDKQSIKYTPYWEVFPMYVIKAGLNQDTISQIVTPPPQGKRNEIGHRTSNGRHRTLDIIHRTLDIGHQTLEIRHQTTDIGRQISDIKHWTSNIRRRISYVGHQTSDIGRRTSNIRHQTSDIESDIKYQTSDVCHWTSDIRHWKPSKTLNRSSLCMSRSVLSF